MQEIHLEIEGMTCSNCARSVTNLLQNKLCEDVNVNFTTGEATFILPSSSKLSTIVEELDKIGFKAYAAGETQTAEKQPFWKLATLEHKFIFSLIFSMPLLLHMVLPHTHWLNNFWLQWLLSTPVLIMGWSYFGNSAFQSIKLKAPNMDVLVTIGSTAAYIYSIYGGLMHLGKQEAHSFLFFETATTIITLVLLGNMIEHRTVKRTTSAIEDLGKLKATTAFVLHLQEGHEHIKEIKAEDLKLGDTIVLKDGDQVPVDCKVFQGEIQADQSVITGESIPINAIKGTQLPAGSIVVGGNARAWVTQLEKDSAISQIIRMVKDAQKNQASIQRIGDKVSNIFVPVVVGISLLTFVVNFALGIALSDAILRAIAVLVISCPCAMGLATPTAIMAAIGRAAQNGILIKGGQTLETFATTKHWVFDKTGTLTSGNFELEKLDNVSSYSNAYLLGIVLKLEQYSSHPIAKSIVSELARFEVDKVQVIGVNEEKGTGMVGQTADGKNWFLGKADAATFNGVTLYEDKKAVLHIQLKDSLRENAKTVIDYAHSKGIKTYLLSGDTAENCNYIAAEIGIETVLANQKPNEKLQFIEQLKKNGMVAMIGDGINDAPALTTANVGISLSSATDIAINASKIALLNKNDLSKLIEAHLIAVHGLKTIHQNLFWAFFYNVVAIPIAAIGLLNPMVAALSMAFSDVIVVGNSIRLKFKRLS